MVEEEEVAASLRPEPPTSSWLTETGSFVVRRRSGLRSIARILYVADDPEEREYGTTALTQAGFEVESAALAGARQMYSERAYDLVLLDMESGDDDWFQLCAEVSNGAKGAPGTPVFVITSSDDEALIDRVYREGAADCTVRPVSWVVVGRRIRQAIASRRRTEIVPRELAGYREHHDRLTGLPNRSMFSDLLSVALDRHREHGYQVGVILLDIDGFRDINETLGRGGGDELLKAVAGRLQSCLRSGDVVARDPESPPRDSVARLSGDEFVLLLNDVEQVDAAAWIAKRLLAGLAEPFQVGDRKIFLSASAGIAVAAPGESSEEELLQHAETAMYHAKKKGRQSYAFYDDYMNDAVVEKLETLNGLRRALTLDELTLVYQPLFDAETGGIRALEGLIRWQHPERGLLAPGEFIPVAEEAGLMYYIDEWVVRKGCEQGRRWVDQGMTSVVLSLNVSRCQLEKPGFASRMKAILDETGFEPSLLQLELSERGVLSSDPATLAELRALKRLGVRLAIDDFGTGQTSLAYLTRFPLDVLKIDRSFVEGVTFDRDDATIVSTILAMSKSLDLKVVAEGVETVEQESFLRDNGCDELQGFLFSKPVDATLVPDWFAAARLVSNGS